MGLNTHGSLDDISSRRGTDFKEIEELCIEL